MYKLLLLATLFVTTPVTAGVIKLTEEINSETARKVAAGLLSTKPGQPIILLINSPGGSVVAGLSILNALELVRERGSSVSCITGALAASMAFHVLARCDHRYALPYSLLLYHEAGKRMYAHTVKVTESWLERELIYFRKFTTPLDNELIQLLGTTRPKFNYHNRNETLWTTSELKAEYPKFKLRILKKLPVKLKLTPADLTDLTILKRQEGHLRIRERGVH